MNGFTVLAGGQGAASNLGQVHHAAPVVAQDVETELSRRGYQVQTRPHVAHHVPTPTLTKARAVSVAVDEGIRQMGLPRGSTHPYRCPSRVCAIPQNQWTALINWCVSTANGYLSRRYSLPTWARQGGLHGIAGLGYAGRLGGFSDWMSENPQVVTMVGTVIAGYGEYLTAKNVQDAIKESTAKQLSKDDVLALVAKLRDNGYVPPGKTAVVAQGASMAARPSWMVPAMIGGAALLVVMLIKK